MTLSQQLDELMGFECARILRVGQTDSDLHIVTYKVGGEYWMTLVESTSETEYSSVYISGDGLDALIGTLDTLTEKQMPRL